MDEAEVMFSRSAPLRAHRLDLARGLRGVAQETSRLSIVLAGVNADPCEKPTLDGQDNPLFSFLDIGYLGPLARDACRDMLRDEGRKMGLRWEVDAMVEMIAGVGAHPLLVRLAASDIAEANPKRPYTVVPADVASVLADFPTRHSAEIREMVESLDRYYAEELDLLRMVVAGDDQFVLAWRREFPEAVNHLASYGVLDTGSMKVAIPVLTDWLEMTSSS
jgi:hypothetical protein